MPPFATEQLRKIFIGGLNLDTTEESLKEYFSRWGETVDVVVMRFPDTRRSRGFGFVTYEKVESVDAVLNAKPHVLDGKEVEPKRAVAKEETPALKDDTEKNLKVFVGGLASATTENDVRDCFTKFCEEAGHGKVDEVMIMKDRENNDRLRGFCFVTFDSPEIVDKVVSVKYFEIRTKTVEVRRAVSRIAMQKKEEKEFGYSRKRMDDRRPRDDYQGSGNRRGNNYGNQMQGGMSGGGMPFFGGGGGGGYGGARGGSGNYGGGFNMNPLALANMMSMIANSMGMGNMGGGGGMGMGAGAMGNMGMNAMGGGSGDGGHNRGGDSSYRNDVGDAFRGSTGNSGGYMKNESSGNLQSHDSVSGYGGQSSAIYNDQGSGSMGDMSNYANAMSAMFGAAGVNPANVQAALYNAAYGASSGSSLGSYDQSSSAYGPSRNSPAGKPAVANRGYKPY